MSNTVLIRFEKPARVEDRLRVAMPVKDCKIQLKKVKKELSKASRRQRESHVKTRRDKAEQIVVQNTQL
eukprot:11997945-Ditylum_brightwellii.AAC.1